MNASELVERFGGTLGRQGRILFAKPFANGRRKTSLRAVERLTEFENHGERVVRGQPLSQAAIDVFLGWQRSLGLDGQERDFYIRQLWDWKASIDLSTMDETGLHAYTRACGWSMARSHARSGDRLAIAAYLGSGSKFDEAIARFSAAYADQNQRDYDRLAGAVASGEVIARTGV